SETAEFVYKTTNFYNLNSERGIMWNDPNINITWPISEVLLSSKDQQHPVLI
ncbi:dTDP-4-dehydrorhamnose 3,5-epimerase family protein, partial [Escherichia coli]